MWGDYQEQKSRLSSPAGVFANGPMMFHVNNPSCGTHGPYMHTCVFPFYNHGTTTTNFVKYAGPSDVDNDENDEKHVPNGPKLKLLFADYQFKFEGFTNDTRITVHFIQQKNLSTDFWNQNDSKQFLPSTISGFRNIAGFDCNEIDRKNYKVLAMRKLFLNASGSSSITSALTHDPTEVTTEATTPPTKYCHVRLNLNKVLTQLKSSLDEVQGDDPQNETVDGSVRPHGASWGYDNQHPLSNIFCLISTDDVTALDGDHVKVDIIRKLAWRDGRA